MNEYLTILENYLKGIEIFVDYSFNYNIDEDARTLKIWIKANFQGGGRFECFEFIILSSNSLIKSKYRYNFIVEQNNLRWDNAPHHKTIKTFPHHLHINSKVVESHEPDLKHVFEYIMKYL